MKTIYKYPIDLGAELFLTMEVPDGTVFLYVGEQLGEVCLWALVDTEAPLVRRHLRIVGTGIDASDLNEDQYIGSVLVLNGTYVYHIFDVGNSIQ